MNADKPPEQRKAKVLIVDDHPIVREGLALFLNAQPDLDASLQAATAAEAVAATQAGQPDLAIVDISLAQESGLDLVKQLRRQAPALGLLVMSLHDETVFAERALRAGASGYLMKQEATAHILEAIRQVLRGEVYLSTAMHKRLAQRLVATEAVPNSPLAGISAREFEILHLLALGFSTQGISDKLNRSVKTVESHRASLKRKLGLQSSADLIRYAVRWFDQGPPNSGFP